MASDTSTKFDQHLSHRYRDISLKKKGRTETQSHTDKDWRTFHHIDKGWIIFFQYTVINGREKRKSLDEGILNSSVGREP